MPAICKNSSLAARGGTHQGKDSVRGVAAFAVVIQIRPNSRALASVLLMAAVLAPGLSDKGRVTGHCLNLGVRLVAGAVVYGVVSGSREKSDGAYDEALALPFAGSVENAPGCVRSVSMSDDASIRLGLQRGCLADNYTFVHNAYFNLEMSSIWRGCPSP